MPTCCARCAAEGNACCEVGPGEKLGTLTRADVDRIRAATGRAARDFAEEEPFTPSEIAAYEDARPLYAGYFRRPARLHLRARGGACVFLDREHGCTLAPDARPTACLLYPFDLDAAGRVTVQDAQGCSAARRCASTSELLREFATSRRRLVQLGRRLAAEVRAHR